MPFHFQFCCSLAVSEQDFVMMGVGLCTRVLKVEILWKIIKQQVYRKGLRHLCALLLSIDSVCLLFQEHA